MERQLSNVKHDYIRYANCWEDADILLEGLQAREGDRILSIASAGDNSFSLLTANPELVVAVDVNFVQLKLCALKKAAFSALEHDEFLQFLGFVKSKNRRELFNKVKTKLSADAGEFWESRWSEVEAGIIHQGKFERYFKLFRTYLLPIIHGKKKVEKLFAAKQEDEQAKFFDDAWNTWRWRGLFKVFFSKAAMGKYGRDPAFLKEVEIPVSEFILGKARNHLRTSACQNNHFLHFILRGNFGDTLPHYARAENYERIKSNIDRIVFFEGFAEDAFKEHSHFSRFNLSNIFEYMNREMFTSVVANLAEHASPSARFAYWNLMVPRKISEVNGHLQNDALASQNLTQKDLGFFYSSFNVDAKK